MSVVLNIEPALDAGEFIDVLLRSSLAERRPVNDRARIEKMLANADVIVTARDAQGQLVGVARAVTDFSYCCYLSDLAVDKNHQGHGIGKALMKRVREEAGQETTFVLLSAPGSMTYYPHAGLDKFDCCFGLRRASSEDSRS